MCQDMCLHVVGVVVVVIVVVVVFCLCRSLRVLCAFVIFVSHVISRGAAHTNISPRMSICPLVFWFGFLMFVCLSAHDFGLFPIYVHS